MVRIGLGKKGAKRKCNKAKRTMRTLFRIWEAAGFELTR